MKLFQNSQDGSAYEVRLREISAGTKKLVRGMG